MWTGSEKGLYVDLDLDSRNKSEHPEKRRIPGASILATRSPPSLSPSLLKVSLQSRPHASLSPRKIQRTSINPSIPQDANTISYNR